MLSYNVHRCRGLDGRVSPARIAQVIAATAADVACLQELDVGGARTGRVHQAEAVAQALGMHFHFHPAIEAAGEAYGDAILSRHPLRLVRAGPLPRPRRRLEPRGALWVEIEAGERRWQILNTHFGLTSLERLAQAAALADWVGAALEHAPVVVCGDLNSATGSRVHRLMSAALRDVQLVAHGTQRSTFATWLPWVCLDYIYVSPDVAVTECRVAADPLSRVASDHFPLVAELQPPRAAAATGSARADAAPPPAAGGERDDRRNRAA